jgi:hypothetical protein
MNEEIPEVVQAWLLALHEKSEAKHGEVAVLKFKIEDVRYSVRIIRTDPNHTIL